MSHRSFVPILIVALAVAATATARERPAAEQKRGAYVVKYAGTKDLAAILAKHFKGAAEIQAGPEGTSNTLLVNAPPAVFDEVMKVIELLDRKPQSVAVEVFVIELPAKKADDKGAGNDEKDLSGPIDDMAKTLDALQKKGQVASVKRIQLTTQEGHAASLLINEAKPFSTGGGSYSYRNTGTQVRVTPQVAADKTVTLDLSVQDSRMVASEDGQPPEFPTMSLTSKVAVASGKAVLAKDAKSTEKSGAGRTLIVVGARLVEPK
jgi:type II secretory pathway component GspD/PulD (secretin)